MEVTASQALQLRITVPAIIATHKTLTQVLCLLGNATAHRADQDQSQSMHDYSFRGSFLECNRALRFPEVQTF